MIGGLRVNTDLRRTLGTASHELGHVLTMYHCTAFRCLMNGSNHQEERDGRPLHLCSVSLRKLFPPRAPFVPPDRNQPTPSTLPEN